MQKGQGLILVIIGILVVGLIAAGAYYLGRSTSSTPKTSPNPVITSQVSKTPQPTIAQTPQATAIPSPTPDEFAKSNFNFVFKYGVESSNIGPRNILDTFKQTYTKDMVTDPPITTNLTLSLNELKQIYQKMLDIGFFQYPNNFVGSGVSVIPHESYYLKVKYGSSIKELSWDYKIPPRDEQLERLYSLSKFIIGIIEAKPEYKSLPEPKGAYL